MRKKERLSEGSNDDENNRLIMDGSVMTFDGFCEN